MPPKKKNGDKKDDKKKTASPAIKPTAATSSPAKKPTDAAAAAAAAAADTTKDSTIDSITLDSTTIGPQSKSTDKPATTKPKEPTMEKDAEMKDADEHDKPPKLASLPSNPHDTPLPKSTASSSTPAEEPRLTDKTEHNKRAAELRAKEKAEKAKNESKQDQEAKKREAEAKAKEEARKKELAAKLPPHQTLLKALNDSLTQLSRGVETHDQRLLNRVVRLITSIRKQMDVSGLQLLVKLYSPEAEQYLKGVESKVKPKPVEDVKMTDASDTTTTTPTPVIQPDEFYLKPPTGEITPEIHVYVLLLVTLFLLDQQAKQEAATSANALFTSLQSHNRRTLDLLSGKVYYYYAYTHELIGQNAMIRNNLLAAHRTACLQHNEPGQAALTTSILRNYLQSNLYAQADTFRLKSTFPENRSTHHHARYLYYLGKINSVQLHYSEAFTNLSQALRKAPQKTAIGFRQHATKLLVCVQLLMGEIPERSLFAQTDLKRSLKPYLQLTQAVRIGDLAAFNRVMTEQKNQFEKDKVYSLIVRLRHNVIKTGLRAINIAYSRISLRDICDKLKLESEEDAEYIVAKAIHDGVIDAVIDRNKKFLFSKENVDVYSTNEPETAFHKRITFCMQIHNDAVKALRFPPNAHKSQAELLEEEDEDDEGNPRATKKKEEEKKEEKKDEKDKKEEKKK